MLGFIRRAWQDRLRTEHIKLCADVAAEAEAVHERISTSMQVGLHVSDEMQDILVLAVEVQLYADRLSRNLAEGQHHLSQDEAEDMLAALKHLQRWRAGWDRGVETMRKQLGMSKREVDELF